MTCESIRLYIHEALDGGGAEALPEPVASHLATCDACREFKVDLESLSRALRELPRAPLPGDALDAVWRETTRARPAASIGVWRLATAASLVAALSTVTLYLVFAPAPPRGPSAVELARASAQAEMVFGYTARALAATRAATTHRILASKVSPAVRHTNSQPSRRP